MISDFPRLLAKYTHNKYTIVSDDFLREASGGKESHVTLPNMAIANHVPDRYCSSFFTTALLAHCGCMGHC